VRVFCTKDGKTTTSPYLRSSDWLTTTRRNAPNVMRKRLYLLCPVTLPLEPQIYVTPSSSTSCSLLPTVDLGHTFQQWILVTPSNSGSWSLLPAVLVEALWMAFFVFVCVYMCVFVCVCLYVCVYRVDLHVSVYQPVSQTCGTSLQSSCIH
jgi:hypothetical protein